MERGTRGDAVSRMDEGERRSVRNERQEELRTSIKPSRAGGCATSRPSRAAHDPTGQAACRPAAGVARALGHEPPASPMSDITSDLPATPPMSLSASSNARF